MAAVDAARDAVLAWVGEGFYHGTVLHYVDGQALIRYVVALQLGVEVAADDEVIAWLRPHMTTYRTSEQTHQDIQSRYAGEIDRVANDQRLVAELAAADAERDQLVGALQHGLRRRVWTLSAAVPWLTAMDRRPRRFAG
jgi:hypothetical protein